MLNFLKNNKSILFQSECFINVTNFDSGPENDLGYACKCNVAIHTDGSIIFSSNNEKLEFVDIKNITRASNNINNYDPAHAIEISIATFDKEIRMSFRSKKLKDRCWQALRTSESHL